MVNKNNGMVLFYNLDGEKGRSIRMLCLRLGLKIKNIEKEQYLEPIGALAGIPGFECTGEVCTEAFEDEMLLMKGFTNQMLNQFLTGFQKMKIEKVSLKAMITETNCTWNSLELHEELQKEHAAMLEAMKK